MVFLITQGMLPPVAFCYASGLRQRMKAVVGFSTVCTVVFSLVNSVVSFVFALALAVAVLLLFRLLGQRVQTAIGEVIR